MTVTWQYGTVEADGSALVVRQDCEAGIFRKRRWQQVSTIPLTSVLRVDKETFADGTNLLLHTAGGETRGLQRCGDVPAVLQLLDRLSRSVAVIENGIEWQLPLIATAVQPKALNCPRCGAPLQRADVRCGYCGVGIAWG